MYLFIVEKLIFSDQGLGMQIGLIDFYFCDEVMCVY